MLAGYTGAEMRLVDYTLAKRAKLTELRGGRLSRDDVCDAHPELLRAARNVGFGPSELRSVLYDLPYPSQERPRAVEPCPLSGRELEVLKRLAKGMVYKQIAHELSLSTSTVRTHLHNIYGKLGAVDRAQAVLHATERGWL